ncbi:MAG: pyridoxal-phosphate dependent enzyme, partial [Rhizobiales bacterium]|nr:pyridoxal-phosphate dependent enzyme [Hyphomicrobiales bacterium]
YAASQLGHDAKIFVPEISSPSKKQKIHDAGADLEVVGQRYADTVALCDAYQKDSGALSIHAYNMDKTIAGQGTVALEWLDQVPDLDTILVAVGGGGLIAGIITACADKCNIIAVEPEGSCCMHQALKAGKPVDVEINSVAADSLGASSIGTKAFEICQHGLAASVIVTDDAIRAAQTALWHKFQIVSEPGGATALSALMCGAYTPKPGERVGVLVCGSNTDLANFAK